jgi:DNA-binding transcriptional ArsR family regulator
MTSPDSLQPTLWRTCRVIANPARLQIFALLLRRPGQTVSTVASRLGLPVSLTSEYLRALEARGLLAARRVGPHVSYRVSPANTAGPAQGLVEALRMAISRTRQPLDLLFKLGTAFTHPRRIEIFRALHAASGSLGQIQAATGIPGRALQRHLRKLAARGFISKREGRYTVVRRSDPLGQELARLAAEFRVAR